LIQSRFEETSIEYKMHGRTCKTLSDDLDAATLYAESAMDLRPGQLWNKMAHQRKVTGEIVSVLESVLKRSPYHIGANHYYIHAIEASPHPERAIPSAERLKPGACGGASRHMPAHIT